MKAATLEKKTHVAKAKHPTELIRKIQKGLRFSELETLQNSIDLPFEQLAAKLSISRSTLQRRKAAGRLSPDESDKVMRLSRLLEHATNVFGDIERARAWLKFPQRGLGEFFARRAFTAHSRAKAVASTADAGTREAPQ